MKEIKITIKTTNAAFEHDKQAEVAKMLRKIADDLEHKSYAPVTINDINGNKVGTIEIN
jgi:uncharacterized protein (UPF0297 family)